MSTVRVWISGWACQTDSSSCDRDWTRSQLLESVWQAQPDIQTRTVDMHVQRLRAKLGAAGDWIETVRAVGYRFREPPLAAARHRRT